MRCGRPLLRLAKRPRPSTRSRSPPTTRKSRCPPAVSRLALSYCRMPRYAIALALLIPLAAAAQGQPPRAEAVTVLRPARVFDGDAMHEGWVVRVEGDRI